MESVLSKECTANARGSCIPGVFEMKKFKEVQVKEKNVSGLKSEFPDRGRESVGHRGLDDHAGFSVSCHGFCKPF